MVFTDPTARLTSGLFTVDVYQNGLLSVDLHDSRFSHDNEQSNSKHTELPFDGLTHNERSMCVVPQMCSRGFACSVERTTVNDLQQHQTSTEHKNAMSTLLECDVAMESHNPVTLRVTQQPAGVSSRPHVSMPVHPRHAVSFRPLLRHDQGNRVSQQVA